MVESKKGGRPRTVNVRRYSENEQGTRTFNIEDLEAEIMTTPNPVRRGNVYIGTEFEDNEVIILVKRKKLQ